MRSGPLKGASKAVFVDRDGTLIVDVGYPRDPELVEFIPGALNALRRLAQLGFSIVVISNQSGIGRGLVSKLEAEQVHQRFIDRLMDFGIQLGGAYYCPHAPTDGCECRKPAPGLIIRAAKELDLNPEQSYFIGDKSSDVEAGERARCRTILLSSDSLARTWTPPPTWLVATWDEVLERISSTSEPQSLSHA